MACGAPTQHVCAHGETTFSKIITFSCDFLPVIDVLETESRMRKLAIFRGLVFMLLILDDSFHHVETLEPVTTTLAVGTAVLGSVLFAGYDKLKCHLYECCDDQWFKPNISGLTRTLYGRLHGQHLVIDTVVKAIRGHVSNTNPDKALVLSFHGWTGSGKNFVSSILVDYLFQRGQQSRFVHLYVGSLHFPHESRIETYKDQLHDWIKGNVSDCPRSLFIFDEMDKMPEGLIDTIKPYLDHYPDINGVDYRKAIFIFLSNTGGNSITRRTLEYWQAGKRREEITHKEMEELINLGAFNEQGGLWHSSLIEKNLITAFVPFLPLERRHVKLCVRDDLVAKNHTVTEEILGHVADELTYWPSDKKIFSKSGCRKVAGKVDLIMLESEEL